MKAARNSGICMKLDDFTGVLSLEHLDVNTMVYLYSEQGELIGKIHSTKSSATFYITSKRTLWSWNVLLCLKMKKVRLRVKKNV